MKKRTLIGALIFLMLLSVFCTCSIVKAEDVSVDYYRYTKKKVMLRVEPTTELDSDIYLKRAKKVHVVGELEEWSVINVDEHLYYVKTSDLCKKKPCPYRYSKKTFKRRGVLHWNHRRWTWYSQRVLPGKGLKIPGRHVDSRGFVCDKNGYICVAAHRKTLKRGAVIRTPFGKWGKVYDTGCRRGTIDVYVNW